MISAPATGCSCSSFISSASAGGQLEQPSEVNSSTSTGVFACPEPVCPTADSDTIRKPAATALERDENRDITCTSPMRLRRPAKDTAHERVPVKELRAGEARCSNHESFRRLHLGPVLQGQVYLLQLRLRRLRARPDGPLHRSPLSRDRQHSSQRLPLERRSPRTCRHPLLRPPNPHPPLPPPSPPPPPPPHP